MSVSIGANAQFWTTKATTFTTANRTLSSISIVDGSNIWATGTDGAVGSTVKQITRSVDGGNTWVSSNIALGTGTTTLGITSITAVSPTTAWVSANPTGTPKGGIWKTVNSGVNWTKQATALFNTTASFANFVYFWDANNGIAQGDPESSYYEIYTTTDGGTTWVRVPSANIPAPAPVADEFGYNNNYAVSGNTIWFATSKGRIFKSSDKGLNWTVSQSPSTDIGSATTGGSYTFSDTSKGLMSLANGNLYNTLDGGATWNIVASAGYFSGDIKYIPNSSEVVSAGSAPAGSSYSLNDGVTWTNIDGTPHGLLAFKNFIGFSAGLNTSATVGGVDKYTGTVLANQSFSNTKNISATPNPTNGNLKLLSSLNGINEVMIFDLQGKQVYVEKFSELNEINLDLSILQTGAYLLKTTTINGIVETLKIMKN